MILSTGKGGKKVNPEKKRLLIDLSNYTCNWSVNVIRKASSF